MSFVITLPAMTAVADLQDNTGSAQPGRGPLSA